MNKKAFLIFLLITALYFMLPGMLHSQVTLEWVKYNSGNPVNITRNEFMRVDASGNSRIAGVYLNDTQAKSFVLQYNSSGTPGPVYWTTNNMIPSCYWIDNNLSTYTGGYYNQGSDKYLNTFKCSLQGFNWEVKDTVYSNGQYEVLDITSDNIGNTYVLRYKGMYYIYKYNSNGSYTRYPLAGISEAAKITIDTRNNDIILVYYGSEIRDGHITRFDSNFNMKWECSFPVTGDIVKLISTPLGKTYTLDDKFGVTNFDTSGIRKWGVPFPGQIKDMVISITEKVFITGDSGNAFINSNGILSKLNKQNGDKICVDKNDEAYTISRYNSKIRISKVTKLFSCNWAYDYSGTAGTLDSAYCISVDSMNNIYIAGIEQASSITSGFTAKFSQGKDTISGTVKYKDDSSSVSAGFVKALKFNQSTLEINKIDEMPIDEYGNFKIAHCIRDTLYIMAYTNGEQWLPTYNDSVIFWQNAVKVYPFPSVNNVNIRVSNFSYNGNINFSGIVYSGENEDKPLNDAYIYLRTEEGFRGYTSSKPDGTFIIHCLENVLYDVIVDRIGFAPLAFKLNFENGNIVNYKIHMQSVIGIPSNRNILPLVFNLYQNFPNPFNPSTTISFDIPKSSDVKIVIYDITGKVITELLNEHMTPGTYNTQWDASNLASGIYFYQLITDDFIESKKMVLIK
ncbi:MAG: T9SS C-terminal target domain-containing protein [Ignavibacteriae bacterium]|nr:MAG: T9SS C-terminal target domain-containing protein [Ignavibacteriota bacterium]